MEVSGLLRGDFGRHTRLVHNLAREVQRLQKDHKRMIAECQQRRVPVLLVVEPDGEINVYGSKRAAVEVIHVPIGEWTGEARTTLEKWIDAAISADHRKIHFMGRWLHKADHRACPTVEKLLDRTVDKVVIGALEGVR